VRVLHDGMGQNREILPAVITPIRECLRL
jgi:hypothetical protein